MKGLLYRDGMMIWNGFRKNLVLVLVLYMALAIGLGMDSILSVLIFLTGNYAVALLNFDENCKWGTYARTLPLSAGAQAAARYLTCLLMIAAGALGALAMMLLAGAARGELDAELVRVDLLTVAVMVFIVLLYDGLALPLAYRFGAARAQGWVIIAYVGLFAAAFLLYRAFPGALQALDTPFVTDVLLGPVGAVLLLALGLALFAVSWAASTAVYRRKEF